jgi:hypothetical protein
VRYEMVLLTVMLGYLTYTNPLFIEQLVGTVLTYVTTKDP